MNYYNEFDAAAADWLEQLVKENLIPAGVVDRRSIVDVQPSDLRGFSQCHFFAGIGGWPLALELAGVSPDEPIWTGSCPCPPFSAAGKGQLCPDCGGKRALAHPLITAGWVCLDCSHEWRSDDRHLLPEFLRLIGECRPSRVLGEQVASESGRLWFAALRAVVERLGYAAGSADLCAAGVGAPHIRQRLFWAADRCGSGLSGLGGHGDDGREPRRLDPVPVGSTSARGDDGGLADDDGARRRLQQKRDGETVPGRQAGEYRLDAARCGDDGGLADAGSRERRGRPDDDELLVLGPAAGWVEGDGEPRGRGADGGLADADGRDAGAERQQRGGQHGQQPQDGGALRRAGGGAWPDVAARVERPRAPDSPWRDADWIFCRDGKWRPVESSLLGLADGVSGGVVPGGHPLAQDAEARVTRLRGYGNAIVPQLATEFIRAIR